MSIPTIEQIVAFHGLLKSKAYGVLCDRHLAEDAAQEAIADALGARSDLDGVVDLEAWCAQIVYNKSKMILRERTRRQKREGLDAPMRSDKRRRTWWHGYSGGDGMVDLPPTSEKELPLDEVAAVLNQIDMFHRQVIVDRYFNGIPDEEIAAKERVTPATIRWRLHEARNAFRAKWTEMFGGE